MTDQITIPRETFNLIERALDIGLDCAQEVADNVHQNLKGYKPHRHAAVDADVATVTASLSAAKAVSEDKRQSVTITSVKMVGGVAPEAELMRQATEQLEGMGFRVEHPKAVQPQAQGESRSLTLAKQQWESWKQYAFELQERLVKYEGGAPMVLNASHPQANEPACDRAYLNGLRAGFGYGISGDEAGYQKSANSYRAMLAAAPEATK